MENGPVAQPNIRVNRSPAASTTSPDNAPHALLDTVTVVETPEGVVLRLYPAGPIPRALAQAVDLTLLGITQAALFAALVVARDFGEGIMLIIAFATQWLYPVFCEVLWGGQTIGKRALGLVVVHEDGSPIQLQASAVRNLLLVIELLFGALPTYACMLATQRFQRLGDLAAGSMVVHVDTSARRRAPAASPDAAQAQIHATALPQPLSLAEQKLLVAFVERLPQLSPERAGELANLLQPLHEKRGHAAVLAVQSMSAGIVGSS